MLERKPITIRSCRAASIGLVTLFAAAGAASASTLVFSDGTFASGNYSTAFTYLQNPGSDSAVWSQCASCGNPNQALQLVINEADGGGAFNSVEVLTGILNTTFTYNPSTQGAITSIGESVDKDFTVNITEGFNNTFRLLIEQDGDYYVAAVSGPPLSGPGTTGYNTISNSSLTAANFDELNPVTGVIGTANPNFAGDPMTFGIAQLLAATAIDGTTATLAYDNLNISLTTAAPEPASLWTLFAGLSALMIGATWRKRRDAAKHGAGLRSSFAVACVMGAGTLCALFAQPAQAATIDPVSFFAEATYTGGGFAYCSNSVPCPGSGPSSAAVSTVLLPSDDTVYSGSGAAAVSGATDPSLSVSAAASAVLDTLPAPKFTFSAEASLTYYFELTQIAGSAFSGSVPVLLNGSSTLSTQSAGGFDSSGSTVSFQVSTADDSDMLFSLPGDNDSGFFQSLDILPNVEYIVTMSASAAAQIFATDDSPVGLSASASIDPTFTVSPDFADDFQLTFSSGIGDVVSGVPEPSSFAMILIGIGALGAGMRVRRRQAAARA